MPLPSDIPVLSDEVADEARNALDAFDRHPKGTAPRQVNKMMTRMALAYPNAKLSEGEAEARMELYCDMLCDLDEEVLAAGFRAAVKAHKFFPSISEIREAAMSQPAPERMVRASRLRALIARHRLGPDHTDEPFLTAEQAAEIKAEVSPEVAAMLDRIVGSEAA